MNSDSIGAKLLDVRYEEKVTPSNVTNNPELRGALIDLDIAKRTGEELGMRMTLINDQYTLVNSIAQKTATESAKDFGSKALDPVLLAGQVAFLASARNDLIDERMKLDAATRVNTDESNALQNKVNALGGATKVERSAYISVWMTAGSLAQAEELLEDALLDHSQWVFESVYTMDRVAFDDRAPSLTNLPHTRRRPAVHELDIEPWGEDGADGAPGGSAGGPDRTPRDSDDDQPTRGDDSGPSGSPLPPTTPSNRAPRRGHGGGPAGGGNGGGGSGGNN